MDASNEAEGGAGRFRAPPHPCLRSFVVEYWGFSRDLAAMGGFSITPDCFGELICCVDDMFAVDESGREKLPTCFLVGLLERPLRVESAGTVRCAAARLQPWSLGRMIARCSDRPGRAWSDAGGLFGPWLAPISERVGRLDWPPVAGIFDEMLTDLTDRWQPGEMDADVAGEFVGEGRRPTAMVARGRHMTARQVERRVRMLTRTSPKQLACLRRFQKARDAIWADPSVDLAGLALDAGYSDQPHMTRDFRRYCGQTPARYARGSAARKTWLAAQDVAFLQERGEGNG